ncbi:type VI secretion system TssO [Pseudozobellia sp. WGM2]|uniref:type VI secretion system TssO n=1 Tax=Pseudozobellia sp. WGM2 TaxID=2787625 RepID=UPI001ADFD797|nr:type VI secretion system TssO [Pseudozobellia sp. WGM2]
MKPNNSKERRLSFLKFFAMFIVTVSAILAAVYFNFKVPMVENELLRKEISLFEGEKNFQRNFYGEMKDLKGLIDSMDIEGQNISFQNSLINDKIVNLQKRIPVKDSTYMYDMHIDVTELYAELQLVKGKLLKLKGAESTIEEYKTALDQCSQDLEQKGRDLFIARSSR